MDELKALTEFEQRTPDEIAKWEAWIDRKADKLQRDLLNRILQDYVGRLETKEDGTLKMSAKNLRIVDEMDAVFNQYRREELNDFLLEFSTSLLAMAGFVGLYYAAAGFPGRLVNRITETDGAVRLRIGIDGKGKIIPGGYLDQLGKTEVVRQQLKSMVLSSLERGSSQDLISKFTKSLSNSPDLEGRLKNYFRQYAYDSFSEIREIKNTEFQVGLNLKFFIYQGSLIDTSRRFCEKRAGKVFSIEETKNWVNDPDLPGKNRPEAYNPLINRGRWNCRHWITYISEDLANELRSQNDN